MTKSAVTRINRRGFIQTAAAALATIPVLARSADAVPKAPTNLRLQQLRTKPVVKWSDFELLGAFHPPTNGVYNYTSMGLTHRWVNGKLHLLGRSSHDKWVLFESLAEEQLSKTFPFPDQPARLVYGDGHMRPFYDVHAVTAAAWENTPIRDAESSVIGATWHEDVQRFYWGHQHDYCNDYVVFPALGASRMPLPAGGGGTIGLWRVTDGMQTQRNRFVCQTLAVPQAWADKYVGGRTLLVGFGWNGYAGQSISSNGGTFGPTFGALFHPDLQRDPNFSLVHGGMLVINNHESGCPPLDNCPAYYSVDTSVDPPVLQRNTLWTFSSGHSFGAWVDLPDKHGVIVPSSNPSSDFYTTIAADPAPTIRTIAVTNPEVLPPWILNHYLQIVDPNIPRKVQARWVTSVVGNVVTFSTDMVQVPPVGQYVFGGVTYPNGVGGFIVTGSENRMQIYDPEELGENVLTKEPQKRQAVPANRVSVDYPGVVNPMAACAWGYCTGLTFVPETRRLYLLVANESWGLGREAAVYVYQLH